jgi:cytochrome c553
MLPQKTSFFKIKWTFLLLLLSCIQTSYVYSETDSPVTKSTSEKFNYTSQDVRIGERLFHGQIPSLKKIINCAGCHNIDAVDTLNWNPSAMDLALKYANLDSASFKSAILEPTGKMMTAIHDSLQLDNQQIRQIRAYLTELARKGVQPAKKLATNRIIFIILILIFFLTIFDLAFSKKVKPILIHTLVLIITFCFITNYIVGAAIAVGRSQNYQPDQPIKFSHKVHAGQNQTNCLYCHFNATQSKHAGIPPTSVCMNCHMIVTEGSRSGKFEINKIYKARADNVPIQWVKVHNLPDHVYFNHAQHVVAGKIDCAKCHGDVTQMDQVVQVQDLSMGWCVKCHRETAVQFDNKFYGKYEKLHEDLREGKIDKVTVEKTGGTDCMKCHY